MDLRELLEGVKDNSIGIDFAIDKLKNLPYEDLGYANIDHHREIRTGYPEVIYCEGKSDEHILGIVEKMTNKNINILCTRCRKTTYEKIKKIYLDANYNEISKILKIQNHTIENTGKGKIVIVTGGTSDIPVADEAYHIIAVPTSVGYGANFNELSALLTMLNSCASGISVVNIDNGFGAGYLASMINKLE